LREWGLDREWLTHVVLTHWHPDHVGSAAELASWPVYSQIAGTVPDATPSRVDRELDDNETLDAIGARVLSTPGHTSGSIALHFPSEDVLFTGDVATEHLGLVMLGPFNQDRARSRESFRRFADIDVDTVCFGHGQPLRGKDTAKLRAAASASEIPDPLG